MEGSYWANFGGWAAKSGSAPGGAMQVRQVQKGVFWAWSRGLQRRYYNGLALRGKLRRASSGLGSNEWPLSG